LTGGLQNLKTASDLGSLAKAFLFKVSQYLYGLWLKIKFKIKKHWPNPRFLKPVLGFVLQAVCQNIMEWNGMFMYSIYLSIYLCLYGTSMSIWHIYFKREAAILLSKAKDLPVVHQSLGDTILGGFRACMFVCMGSHV